MRIKYDLAQMLKEIKEDEKVFRHKKNYWASQNDIRDLIKKRKQKGQAQ
tara:strand:+ start:1804 stop:1950 length:147 start_codon:yes stop_codon:yes gene_type:complete